MNNSLKSTSILVAVLVLMIGVLVAGIITLEAQEADDRGITFPVAELGNCESEQSCKAYCDDLSHINECVDFAEANNLMSSDDAREARGFAKAGAVGPGNCNSRDTCHSYCEEIVNINECLAFAEEHEVIDKQHVEEAKKVAKALNEGHKLPGGCKNMRECEAFCSQPGNMRQCLQFAEAAGFMDQRELEEANKVADFIEKGGQLPGGCQNERSCEAYCSDDSHINECMDFALEAGFVSEKDAELMRKTGGKGPGGCKGRECETFCNNPANQEACFEFAKEHGLISDDDVEGFGNNMKMAREGLKNAPPEVIECINRKAPGAVQLIRSGKPIKDFKIGDAVRTCFEEFGNFGREDHDQRGPQGQQGPQGGPQGQQRPQGQQGPGNFDMPLNAKRCLEEKYGNDFEQKMQRGELNPRDFESVIRTCMENNIDGPRYEDYPMPNSFGDDFRPDGDHQEFDNFSGNKEEFERNQRELHEGEFPPDFDESYIGPPDGQHDEFNGEVDNSQINYDDAYRAQYEEEYKARYDEEFKAQFDQQYQNQSPPDGGTYDGNYDTQYQNQPPPDGGTYDGTRDSQYQNQPPPDGGTYDGNYDTQYQNQSPPSNDQPPPTSDQSAPTSLSINMFLANVITAFAALFGL